MQKKSLMASILASTLFFLGGSCTLGKRISSSNIHNGLPNGDRYVVVLSLDGFRADYQSKANTPNLDEMDREGTFGKLLPSYPTLTFPNHYSMATGLYPNNHGLVGNEFWTEDNRHYRLGDRESVSNPIFYKGEPLWNTARRNGIRSASFFWVGSETPINGYHPNRWKPFDSKVPYTDRADSVISWLRLPEPERPHLIMWYIEEPDHTGHHESPDDPKTFRMVEKMDSVVGYFRQQLAQTAIGKQVDFILVSDHGMATIKQTINLADYLPIDSFTHVATGPFTHLYPKAGYTDKALEILKTIPHIDAYRKEELPERLHYGKNKETGEIVVIARLGTQIYFNPKGGRPTLRGAHGFDNKHSEMHAVFKAVGPHFRSGYKVLDPLPNITLYPLVCEILRMTPAKNDAQLSDATKLLVNLDK